jgi:hypothetical protein
MRECAIECAAELVCILCTDFLCTAFCPTARVPLDGFDPPLNITQGDADMALNSLPRAHTCFNQLVLPRYSKYEMCVKQLRFAMENTVGFELT